MAAARAGPEQRCRAARRPAASGRGDHGVVGREPLDAGHDRAQRLARAVLHRRGGEQAGRDEGEVRRRRRARSARRRRRGRRGRGPSRARNSTGLTNDRDEVARARCAGRSARMVLDDRAAVAVARHQSLDQRAAGEAQEHVLQGAAPRPATDSARSPRLVHLGQRRRRRRRCRRSTRSASASMRSPSRSSWSSAAACSPAAKRSSTTSRVACVGDQLARASPRRRSGRRP